MHTRCHLLTLSHPHPIPPHPITHTPSLQDTEFPGIVAKPIGDFKSASDYQYQLLQTNVNLLKLIQLGITFYNREGERPPGVSTFQFNFKFCLR